MMITFSIIIFANIVKPQDEEKCPKQVIKRDQVDMSDLYKQCYCINQSFKDMSTNADLRSICWDTWYKYITTFTLSIITGLVILIVNFLLKKVIERLNKFNKYRSITQQSKSTLINLFLALFINTTFITLIIQANIEGFIPAVQISRPIPQIEQIQQEKIQNFEVDFDRSWYLSVGTKITLTMIYFIMTHFFSEYVLAFFYRWRREINTKKLCGKALQRKANLTLQGPEFPITYYYAAILNVIFTTLFFSSGIPILIPIGAIILIMQYWVYKYRFLRICRKPPTYDGLLNNTVLQIVPFALIFHSLIGCYMYGQPLIFPKSKDEIIVEIIKMNKGYEMIVEGYQSDPVNQRFQNSQLFAVLAIVSISLILSMNLLKNIFSVKYKNKAFPYLEKKKDYKNQLQTIQQRTVASYDIRKNDQYKDIIDTIDNQAIVMNKYISKNP